MDGPMFTLAERIEVCQRLLLTSPGRAARGMYLAEDWGLLVAAGLRNERDCRGLLKLDGSKPPAFERGLQDGLTLKRLESREADHGERGPTDAGDGQAADAPAHS